MNVVCNLHSMKRREIQGISSRVCDLCERQRYEADIHQEYTSQLEQLKSQLSDIRIDTQQHKSSIQNKENDIIKVQERCNEDLKNTQELETRLNIQIENIMKENEWKHKEIARLEQEKVAAQQEEQRIKEKLTSSVLYKAALNEEVQALTFRVDELNEMAEGLAQRSVRCFYWERTGKNFCRKCQKTIEDMGASLRSVERTECGQDSG